MDLHTQDKSAEKTMKKDTSGSSINRKKVIFWVFEAPFLCHSILDCSCWLWYTVPVFYRLDTGIVFPIDSCL